MFWDWYVRTLINEVVNFKDIIDLQIKGCWCMALRMFKYVY